MSQKHICDWFWLHIIPPRPLQYEFPVGTVGGGVAVASVHNQRWMVAGVMYVQQLKHSSRNLLGYDTNPIPPENWTQR